MIEYLPTINNEVIYIFEYDTVRSLSVVLLLKNTFFATVLHPSLMYV